MKTINPIILCCLLFISVITHAASYKYQLPSGEILTLKDIEFSTDDFALDMSLALEAFFQAFKNQAPEILERHFGPDRNIQAFFSNLITEDDIAPFRAGQLIWVRAFLADQLVGWMTIAPKFISPENSYLSTLVVDPAFQKRGIGKVMIESIATHWLPETKEIDLVVRRINETAITFYLRLGFSWAPEIAHKNQGNPELCAFMKIDAQLIRERAQVVFTSKNETVYCPIPDHLLCRGFSAKEEQGRDAPFIYDPENGVYFQRRHAATEYLSPLPNS